MVTYDDTSFLFALYGNDAQSSRALGWLRGQRTPLAISTLNEFELGNALRFAEARKVIAPGEGAVFWAQFEADRASGKLCLWS